MMSRYLRSKISLLLVRMFIIILSRIYNALKDDIFLIRLKQLAWQEYCSQKYVAMMVLIVD